MVVKTLAKSVRQYKKESILAPFFIVLEVVLECLIPLIMAKLIDEMDGQSLMPLLKYGVPLILMAILSLLTGVASGKYAATASCGFARNLRHDLYYAIQDFSFADIDRFSDSSLVTRMTTDVTNVQNAYQMMIRMAFRAPLMIVFSFIMGLSINWMLSMIFLAIIPVLAVALGLIIGKVHPFFKKIFKKYDAMNNSVQENVGGIRVVKAYVREDYEKEKFNRASDDVRKDFTTAERILALNTPIMQFCIFLAITLISFFGAQIIVRTNEMGMTRGELMSMINYGTQMLTALMMLSMVFVMLTMASESSVRIAEVLQQKPGLTDNPDGEKTVADGSICFKNVDFRYSEKAERNALEHINLEIASGETVGIIGGTGSSKT